MEMESKTSHEQCKPKMLVWIPQKCIFKCCCSEPCGHKLSLLFGEELLHVTLEDEDSALFFFIDRDTAKQIARLLNEWLEERG